MSYYYFQQELQSIPLSFKKSSQQGFQYEVKNYNRPNSPEHTENYRTTYWHSPSNQFQHVKKIQDTYSSLRKTVDFKTIKYPEEKSKHRGSVI